jgi:hypothetical protein
VEVVDFGWSRCHPLRGARHPFTHGPSMPYMVVILPVLCGVDCEDASGDSSFPPSPPSSEWSNRVPKRSRANPRGPLHPRGTARFAHRYAALDLFVPRLEAAGCRVREGFGVCSRWSRPVFSLGGSAIRSYVVTPG